MIDHNSRSIYILFVDDSIVIRDMLESCLLELGYLNIVSAVDGLDALEKIEYSENEFDFIITDINMPNMDGLTLIATLRSKLDYSSTPIMVLSTERSDSMKLKGKEVGATSWVVKPFNVELINSAIKQTIQRVNMDN